MIEVIVRKGSLDRINIEVRQGNKTISRMQLEDVSHVSVDQRVDVRVFDQKRN